VVGYGVGYIIDHAEDSDALRAPKEELYGMDEGDSTVVVMHDGRRIAGRFAGIGIPNSADIIALAFVAGADRTAGADSCEKRWQLHVGDVIELWLEEDEFITTVFLGGHREGLLHGNPERGLIFEEDWSDLAGIRWCGMHKELPPPLRYEFERGAIESVELVRMRTAEGEQSLRMWSVKRILEEKAPKRMRGTLAIVGFGADLVLGYFLIGTGNGREFLEFLGDAIFQ
jgi:hypothetical protein